MLTLGAGAGRLSYDLHRRYAPGALRRARLESAARLRSEPRAPRRQDRAARVPDRAARQGVVRGRAHLRRARAVARGAARASRSCSRTRSKPRSSPRASTRVLTPWLVDVVPQSFVDCVRTVNRLLKKRGTWVNTGSLAFFHRDAAWCVQPGGSRRDRRGERLRRGRDRARGRAVPAIPRERPRPHRARVQLHGREDRRRGAARATRNICRRGCSMRGGPCPISTSSSSRRRSACCRRRSSRRSTAGAASTRSRSSSRSAISCSRPKRRVPCAASLLELYESALGDKARPRGSRSSSERAPARTRDQPRLSAVAGTPAGGGRGTSASRRLNCWRSSM